MEDRIYVPDEENIGRDLVDIRLIDEGFFIVLNMKGKETDVLFEIIQNVMYNNKGIKRIKIIIEEE